MKRTIVAILFFAASECAHAPAVESDVATVIREVSRNVLLGAKEAPEGDYLLVIDRTSHFALREREVLDATDAGIPKDLLQQLLAASERRIVLPAGNELRPISSRIVNQIFADGPHWDRFYAAYPHSRGFVELSGPIFKHDGTEALVYVDYSCYGDCGGVALSI